MPAVLLGAASFTIYRGLNILGDHPTGRLVEIALGLVALPLPLGTLLCMVAALRWLLLAAWPKRVGVFAGPTQLLLQLGPFGTKRYDAAGLDVSYPYELIDDPDSEGFEAYLPEEEQERRLLPRLRERGAHGPVGMRLDHKILRFTDGDEAGAAELLRPAVQRWRAAAGVTARPSADNDDAGETGDEEGS